MADKYFINGGVDSLWATTGNWSLTSGGGGGAGVPSSSEAVFFDANSPNCSLTGSRAALSVNFTGYTNTFTCSSGVLTVSGSVTLAAAMGFVGGSASIVVNATATITSNGKAFPVQTTLSGAGAIFTFADNATFTGSLILGSGTNAVTVNGSTITCNGGLRYAGTTGLVTGTTILKLAATQTLDAPSASSGRIGNIINIDAGAGTITCSVLFFVDFNKLLLTSGTVVTTAGTWAAVGGGSGGLQSARGFTGGFAT
jgi:hypothetical protein